MQRLIALFMTVTSLAILSNLELATAQAVDRMTDLQRDQFIQNFKRIGLNTTPGDAMTLRILVQAARAKRGVEVGTATGYGALNMGIAFERTGGKLVTIDIDPQMVQTARAHLKTVGLDQTVEVIEGDALKVLSTLPGQYDFLFLDAVKSDYLKYFQLMSPKLTPGALVVADNVIRSENQMKDFLEFMAKNTDYEKVTIRASMEKNDGMAIYFKLR